MAQVRNDNIRCNAPKLLDDRAGKISSGVHVPYASTAEANLAINIAYRAIGLTVNIIVGGVLTEYWYKDGIADINLVPKYTGFITSLSTTGSSGAATYNSTTGALNIPNYSGGGGSYTSDNAITLTGSNFQLGGSLLHNTDITTIGYDFNLFADVDTSKNYISLQDNSGSPQLSAYFEDTGASKWSSLFLGGTGGAGLFGGYGFTGQYNQVTVRDDTGGVYVVATNMPDSSAVFVNPTTVTLDAQTYTNIRSKPTGSGNTVSPIVKLFRQEASGVATDGIGGSIDFQTTTEFPTFISNQLISKWTTALSTARTSQFIITGVNNTVTADLFTINGNGSLRANKYGVNTFGDTPAYALGVKADGSVIEFAVGGGGGGSYTSDNGITLTGSNFQLGGTLLQNTTIDNIGYNLKITGTHSVEGEANVLFENTSASNYACAVRIINTGSAFLSEGLHVENDGWVGIYAQGVFGGSFLSNSGGGQAVSAVALAAAGSAYRGTSANPTAPTAWFANEDETVNNAVQSTLELNRFNNAGANDGLGQSIDFIITYNNSGDYTGAAVSNRLISKWTTVDRNTRTSQFIITGVNSAITSDLLTINGNGDILINNIRTYANDAAADADSTLASKSLYKITGSRVIYQKP